MNFHDPKLNYMYRKNTIEFAYKYWSLIFAVFCRSHFFVILITYLLFNLKYIIFYILLY